MSEMIRAKDAVLQWGLKERHITGMYQDGKNQRCQEKRVLVCSRGCGATGRRPRPFRVIYQNGNEKKLHLPVGISDYRVASTQYYYMDKTLLIRDFLDERPMGVSLYSLAVL